MKKLELKGTKLDKKEMKNILGGTWPKLDPVQECMKNATNATERLMCANGGGGR